MTVIFCDTETTGIEPINSAPFEIALLVYKDGKYITEKVWHLNPLDDEVLYHQDAYKVHGVKEETIRGYPSASEVIPEIAAFLKEYMPEEKLVFAGYKCDFDYKHLSALLFRFGNGVLIQDLFNGEMIDVLEHVKKAQSLKIIPKTDNQKLETMTKALGIPHEGAHGALSDIRATRLLYETIYAIERKGRV
jgi:DNA polymerase III epsilon subunit-like protein